MVELRLVVLMPKDQPVNDAGVEVLWSETGDRRKLVVLKVPGNDFPSQDFSKWGAAFQQIRSRYATALNIDERQMRVYLISG